VTLHDHANLSRETAEDVGTCALEYENLASMKDIGGLLFCKPITPISQRVFCVFCEGCVKATALASRSVYLFPPCLPKQRPTLMAKRMSSSLTTIASSRP
jgi:hypothetical protein